MSPLLNQGNEWCVGLENILAVQILDGDPIQSLPIERLRRAAEGVDQEKMQPDPAILVVMIQRHRKLGLTDFDAQLLAQFTPQRHSLCLPCCDFAPRKLSPPRHVLAGWTAGHKHSTDIIE